MFITFEGQEGAGKSTQIKLLHDYFVSMNADVIMTREPGGTAIAEKIRDILKDTANVALAKKTEALLYMAARAQLLDEVILPHLARDGIVLADRFTDSTIAYQGFGNALNIADLDYINNFAASGLVPDITFYLRIDVAAGLARKLAQGKPDRIEQKNLAYHMAVQEGYEYLLKAYPRRIIPINGGLPRDDIHETIRDHITNYKRRKNL